MYTPPKDVCAQLDQLLGEPEISYRPLDSGGTLVVVQKQGVHVGNFMADERDSPERIAALWRGLVIRLRSSMADGALMRASTRGIRLS